MPTILLMGLTAQLGCSQECMVDETSGVICTSPSLTGAELFITHGLLMLVEGLTKTIGVNAWLIQLSHRLWKNIGGDRRPYLRLWSELCFNAFSSPMNESVLARARKFVSYDAPFFLVDIDPDSSEYGRLRHTARNTTRKKHALWNSIAVLPPFGLTLRSDTTYALIATNAGRDNDSSSSE